MLESEWKTHSFSTTCGKEIARSRLSAQRSFWTVLHEGPTERRRSSDLSTGWSWLNPWLATSNLLVLVAAEDHSRTRKFSCQGFFSSTVDSQEICWNLARRLLPFMVTDKRATSGEVPPTSIDSHRLRDLSRSPTNQSLSQSPSYRGRSKKTNQKSEPPPFSDPFPSLFGTWPRPSASSQLPCRLFIVLAAARHRDPCRPLTSALTTLAGAADSALPEWPGSANSAHGRSAVGQNDRVRHES